jgi:hypothetical protein
MGLKPLQNANLAPVVIATLRLKGRRRRPDPASTRSVVQSIHSVITNVIHARRRFGPVAIRAWLLADSGQRHTKRVECSRPPHLVRMAARPRFSISTLSRAAAEVRARQCSPLAILPRPRASARPVTRHSSLWSNTFYRGRPRGPRGPKESWHRLDP